MRCNHVVHLHSGWLLATEGPANLVFDRPTKCLWCGGGARSVTIAITASRWSRLYTPYLRLGKTHCTAQCFCSQLASCSATCPHALRLVCCGDTNLGKDPNWHELRGVHVSIHVKTSNSSGCVEAGQHTAGQAWWRMLEAVRSNNALDSRA
jgi:hypothetical protein